MVIINYNYGGIFILHWIQQDKDLEEHPNKARIMYFARSFNLPPLLIQYLFFHNIKIGKIFINSYTLRLIIYITLFCVTI